MMMTSVLEVLLEFLRVLRLAKDHIQRVPGRWASLLAFLGRKLTALLRHRCRGQGKPGTLRRPKPSEPPFCGTTRSSAYSVSGAPAVSSREYHDVVVAASTVPNSANYPNLLQERQTATVTTTAALGTPTPAVSSLSVDQLHVTNPLHPFEGRSLANRSSGNMSAVSIQSRASSRLSIITNSRESTRARPAGQPSRLPRATHRQFGRGPDPSRSRDHLSRSPSPMNRSRSPHQLPRLEIFTTNLSPYSHGDSSVNPAVQPSVSSYPHEPQSPSPSDEKERKQSLSSVVFEFQNPSTESLPVSPSINPPQFTEKPFTVDTGTAHSSPVTAAADLQDEGHICSLATSLPDCFLPEGRSVQLINSDQVPRYTKNAVMQVGSIITLLQPFTSVSRSREETEYYVKPLTTVFHQYVMTWMTSFGLH
jgi:hypothetical protein